MILTALNRQDMHSSIIILSGWKYQTALRNTPVIHQEMKAGTRLKFVNYLILNVVTGTRQTCAEFQTMSALQQKADIEFNPCNVRLVR